ncbi:MAG: hypothetical protein LBN25_02490 [Christensenellaceae bacterium]|jgi:hypothetical protein|nr:hypothetical protein [Christensenellaceae bacterium]
MDFASLMPLLLAMQGGNADIASLLPFLQGNKQQPPIFTPCQTTDTSSFEAINKMLNPSADCAPGGNPSQGGSIDLGSLGGLGGAGGIGGLGGLLGGLGGAGGNSNMLQLLLPLLMNNQKGGCVPPSCDPPKKPRRCDFNLIEDFLPVYALNTLNKCILAE